jgi:hypothetical protein
MLIHYSQVTDAQEELAQLTAFEAQQLAEVFGCDAFWSDTEQEFYAFTAEDVWDERNGESPSTSEENVGETISWVRLTSDRYQRAIDIVDGDEDYAEAPATNRNGRLLAAMLIAIGVLWLGSQVGWLAPRMVQQVQYSRQR